MNTARATKLLIVNADDLGASPGITRGILEAHARGIVTSASLMVDTPWSREAALLARPATRLSVGLHADLSSPASANRDVGEALRRQFARFTILMGRRPTHIDSHHNAHRDPERRESFLAFAREAGLPLRGEPPVRYFPGFYGRWGGESHPEHVSVASLIGMLEREVREGITELGCHPGYLDPRVPTRYAAEREAELATLCDPRLLAALATLGIALVSFHDLGRIAAAAGANGRGAGRGDWPAERASGRHADRAGSETDSRAGHRGV